jgi:hypothetical protein
MRIAVAIRVVSAVLAAACALSACDTDAQGVEDCRDVERARCEAARHCDVGIDSPEDVEACKRFARDNCLHGFEVEDTASSSEVRSCVESIQAAGACAEAGGRQALARPCKGLLENIAWGRTACEVVDRPELAPACQFLVAEPPEDEDAGRTPPPEPSPDATTDAG